MTRLLTTTAILVSLSGAAFAESHSTSTEADTTTNTQSETTMNTDTNTMATEMAIGSVQASATDFYASNLIGMRVYNVEADLDETAPVADGAETEWEDIGEINDIIVSADGKVSAVILGIGGFIGIGERDVSVPMSAIKVLTEADDGDDRFLVVKTSKEELEQAPEFDRELN